MKPLLHYPPEERLLAIAYMLESWIARMPFAQGVLVMVAVGVLIGTLSYDEATTLAIVIRYVSAGAVLFFGLLSLYILSKDRRYPRRYLQAAILILLSLDLSYFIPIPDVLYSIIHGLGVLGLVIVLFLMTIRHGIKCIPMEKERRYHDGHSFHY